MKIQEGCLYIPCAEGMRSIDRYCADRLGIPVYGLMKNAGASVADYICHVAGEISSGAVAMPSETKIVILCGTGNNGGDGYAAAELLFARGFDVALVMALGKPPKNGAEIGSGSGVEPSAAAYAFYEKCAGIPVFALHGSDLNGKNAVADGENTNKAENPDVSFAEKSDVFSAGNSDVFFAEKLAENKKIYELISAADIIVDAVFGTGTAAGMGTETGTTAKTVAEEVKTAAAAKATKQLAEPVFPRPLPESCCEIFAAAERSKAVKIAVDIPSGLDCDTGFAAENAFRADFTLTLHLPKMGLYINRGQKFCGKITVADIGIPDAATDFAVEKFGIRNLAASKKLLVSAFPVRKSDSHKGSFGRLLFLCGGYADADEEAGYDAGASVDEGRSVGGADAGSRGGDNIGGRQSSGCSGYGRSGGANSGYRRSGSANSGGYSGGASMTGAPYLALLSALRCGAGLCELMSEKEVVRTVQSRLAEPVFSWYGRTYSGIYSACGHSYDSRIDSDSRHSSARGHDSACGIAPTCEYNAVNRYGGGASYAAYNAADFAAIKAKVQKSDVILCGCGLGGGVRSEAVVYNLVSALTMQNQDFAQNVDFTEKADFAQNANAEGTNAGNAQNARGHCKNKPYRLILDADALNIISRCVNAPEKDADADKSTRGDLRNGVCGDADKGGYSLLDDHEKRKKIAEFITSPPPKGSVRVLTPHPLELARLIGSDLRSVLSNRLGTALEAAKRFHSIVVSKGQNTIIAAPDGRVFVNTSGGPGLAKGGSGDVLAGIISALLAVLPEVSAYKYGCGEMRRGGCDAKTVETVELPEADKILTAALEKTAAAVYLHGLAGDLLTKKVSEYGVLPSELPMAAAEIIASLSGTEKNRI